MSTAYLAIKLLGSFVELYFFLEQVNNLTDEIVNEVKDISKVVPGPDVAIANKDHEDIENTRESEMIEAAMKIKEGASK